MSSKSQDSKTNLVRECTSEISVADLRGGFRLVLSHMYTSRLEFSLTSEFRYHSDDAITKKYTHLTWKTTDGQFYVGTDPPAGAQMLGVYYPRAGTL